MKASEELARLVAQERAIVPPPDAVERGWANLHDAVAAGTSPLAVAVTPLKLASVGAAVKVGVVPLVLGSVVGLGAMGVAGLALHAPTATAPSAASVPSALSAETPRAVGRPSLPDAPAAASVAAPKTPASASELPGAVSPAAATFDAELALIQRAKSALDAGQDAAAREWLAAHRREFPRGVFASEREGLSILLACQSGDREAGRAAARRYLRAPSVLVDRIERACGPRDEEFEPDK